jgi:hypothetical protein
VVGLQLPPRRLQQLTRRASILCHVAVKRVRSLVSVSPAVADKSSTEASPEHKGGAQTGRTAAYDYGVV